MANDGNGSSYAYTPDGTLIAANAKGTAEDTTSGGSSTADCVILNDSQKQPENSICTP